MSGPRHKMILASAGSGKTYALTDRFVQLLALGALPEQVVALTFTRKAAGEFFDGILNKLAGAATDPEKARRLATAIEVPAADPPAFLRLLRLVVDSMPRLSLGTFDAFFARVVRSFPLELGLAGDFEVLQEHAALIERRRVLEQIFRRTGTGPDEHQRDFIEAFKRATFGLEEKRLSAKLDDFISNHHGVYLAAPEAGLWGNASAIWPDGCSWLDGDGGVPTGALEAWALAAPLGDKQRERWLDFLAAVIVWTPGAEIHRKLGYVLEKALDAWDDLGRGSAVLEFDRKKQELSAPACSALRAIAKHVAGGEITRRLEITRGIHAVLHEYERVYQDVVRRSGRLTFADVQRLLQQDDVLGLGSGTPDATPEALARAERRMLIDWRLDGQFQHWLLDEFQDTSAGQWSVLHNLVDEVVQDDSGRRTLFYVGDVKQAIYAWREGDSRLFREIFNHYNSAAPGTITEGRLDQSWRSGPAILDPVNAVFGDPAVLEDLFPREAARRWTAEWREHTSAVPDRAGHSAWIHADEEEERLDATLRILRVIDAPGRGLTAAVLTQTNEDTALIAGHLRRAGLRAVAEADQHVCIDNPITAALLALFKSAAHPGDSLAREHARMAPLPRGPGARAGGGLDAITLEMLGLVHEEGFEAAVETWLHRLEPTLAPGDAFSRERGRQMAEAARLFDESGSRDVAEFIQFMERHVVREAEAGAVVRVMTIHKSKGLGFDVVVLPDLEGNTLAQRRDGLAVSKTADRHTEWILQLPQQVFHSRDRVLAAHVESAAADACYDKLALLYVALTRARHGLFIVTKNPAGSKSHNFPQLLARTLGDKAGEISIGTESFTGPWSKGEPRWYEAFKTGVAEKPAPLTFGAVDPLLFRNRPKRLEARTPSSMHGGRVSGAHLFGSRRDAADFGAEVHRLFAMVEWWRPQDREFWRAAARRHGFGSEAIALAESCLDAPALARVFSPQPEPCTTIEVWREQAFEMVDGPAWVTGTFDRVVIERDANGGFRRARIYDFKTDRVSGDPAEWTAAAARHARQMAVYRRAACMLTGLVPRNVTSEIILVNAATGEGRRAGPIEVR